MTREIKFRGFNPATNEIISWEGMQGWTMGGLGSPNIMQYTGLKDKNGKEIYEGDIVNVLGGYSVVTYGVQDIGHDFQGVGFYTQEIGDDTGVFNIFGGEGIEVIGNIYSNPELLEIFIC